MTEHLDYDSLRADTVRQVAKLMAAAAITAPKSGGQLFLAGKHLFIETVIVDDRETLNQLAAWMRARGKERREAIWFRDAEGAEAIDAVLFVGLADWYPPVIEPDRLLDCLASRGLPQHWRLPMPSTRLHSALHKLNPANVSRTARSCRR